VAKTVVKDEKPAGQMAILATAVLMSTNGLFIKLLVWHPVVITCLRSLLAAVFLLVVRLVVPPPKGLKNPPFAFWAAGITFAATMFTFVIANKLTTSANAIMLQYSSPIWAALFGWLLIKEKPHWEHWAALLLVFWGLALFFHDGLGRGALLGDGLAVFSGILYGIQSVFLRMMKDGNPRDAMLLAHVLCAVAGIPFILLYPPSFSVSSALSILYMGTVQIGLASLLFAYGLKRISAVQAMLIAVAEPILNPVWVMAITGEKPSVTAIAGGVIIIAAVVASSFVGKRREEHAFALFISKHGEKQSPEIKP
jgi:drug/metabolite transporter (DMT)-like permease